VCVCARARVFTFLQKGAAYQSSAALKPQDKKSTIRTHLIGLRTLPALHASMLSCLSSGTSKSLTDCVYVFVVIHAHPICPRTPSPPPHIPAHIHTHLHTHIQVQTHNTNTHNYMQDGLTDSEERLGVEIVRKALQAPCRIIAENAGVEGEVRVCVCACVRACVREYVCKPAHFFLFDLCSCANFKRLADWLPHVIYT